MKTRELLIIGIIGIIVIVSSIGMIQFSSVSYDVEYCQDWCDVEELSKLGCNSQVIDFINRATNIFDENFDNTYFIINWIGLPDSISQEKFDECLDIIREKRLESLENTDLDSTLGTHVPKVTSKEKDNLTTVTSNSFTIIEENVEFIVPYKITNAAISDFNLDCTKGTLSLSLDTTNDGVLELEIPQKMISGIFQVEINNQYSEISSIIEGKLTINFPYDSENIVIFGTNNLSEDKYDGVCDGVTDYKEKMKNNDIPICDQNPKHDFGKCKRVYEEPNYSLQHVIDICNSTGFEFTEQKSWWNTTHYLDTFDCKFLDKVRGSQTYGQPIENYEPEPPTISDEQNQMIQDYCETGIRHPDMMGIPQCIKEPDWQKGECERDAYGNFYGCLPQYDYWAILFSSPIAYVVVFGTLGLIVGISIVIIYVWRKRK